MSRPSHSTPRYIKRAIAETRKELIPSERDSRARSTKDPSYSMCPTTAQQGKKPRNQVQAEYFVKQAAEAQHLLARYRKELVDTQAELAQLIQDNAPVYRLHYTLVLMKGDYRRVRNAVHTAEMTAQKAAKQTAIWEKSRAKYIDSLGIETQTVSSASESELSQSWDHLP